MKRTWLLVALMGGLLIGGTQSLLLGQATDFASEIAAGNEVSFPIKYQVVFDYPMHPGILKLSKSKLDFGGSCAINRGGGRTEQCDFQISPDKIVQLRNEPNGPASRIFMKLIVKDEKGTKEKKRDYYFYNSGAADVGNGYVRCEACDDSLNTLYTLLKKFRDNRLSATSNAPATLEEELDAQYPVGDVLVLLATEIPGTTGCGLPPMSTFKVADGKLHTPRIGQNIALAAVNCAPATIDPGTQVSITSVKVFLKNARVAFIVGQGDVTAEVDFEFSRGFLETAKLAQVQEVIENVFSVTSNAGTQDQGAEIVPPSPAALPVAPFNLPSTYVSAQTPTTAEEIRPGAGSDNGSVSDQAKPVLDRAVQFFGGVANIRAIRDIELQETHRFSGGASEIQLHSISIFPGILWYEFKLISSTQTHQSFAFFDGTNGWQTTDGSLSDMSEDEKKSAWEVFSEPLSLVGLLGSPTVTYETKDGVNDVLSFRKGNLVVRLYIDLTGQVVKLAYRLGTDDIEDSFSDYREVSGVKVPYKVSKTRNGKKFDDGQVTDAKPNTNPSLEKLAQKPGGPPLGATYLASIAPLQYPSLYVSAQTPADRLQLNADYTFQLQEGGQPYHGTFAIRGNTLLLNINESNIQTPLTRQGHDLADSNGQTWSYREQSAGTAASGAVLHNEDIIKLATVGIDDVTIVAKITSSKCQFDTSTDALVLLKRSGVSAVVMKAMVGVE
jgi:hypothetical protein